MPRLGLTLLILLGLLFGGAVIALRYFVLPGIEQYRDDILASVSVKTGMRVSAAQLSGGWSGLRPYIELDGVRFSDQKAGETGLALDKLHASLSWWALLVGQLRFHEVILQRPELRLHRDKEGLIRFNGRALNRKSDTDEADLLPWLLEQPHLIVQNAVFVWQDDLSAAPVLHINDVNVRVEKSGGIHRIGAYASPPRALAKRLEASAELALVPAASQDAAGWHTSGQMYVALDAASLVELRRYIPIPAVVRTASGNARAWLELDTRLPHGLKSITADLNAVHVAAQWSNETDPVVLATLAGRLDYRTEAGGFAISSKGLQLRTGKGVRMTPMDFSVRLAEAEGQVTGGEITGEGIDLQVMSALLNYFPVGKELRQQVAAFAPQGTISAASVAWTGKPGQYSNYRLQASVSDLGLNSVDHLPGLRGVSGTVEGNEKGGRFSLDSSNATLDLSSVFRAPLKFDLLKLSGNWEPLAGDGVKVKINSSRLENAAFAGEVKGSWRSSSKGPGIADIGAEFERVELSQLATYFPNSMPGTRTWLKRALTAGKMTAVKIQISGDLWEFPFKDDQHGKFQVSGRGEDARLKFLEGWPAISGISGEIAMQGARISVRAEKAQIFQSRLGATLAEVDDVTSWVPMLTVKGSANASAQDVARYLRESPLRDGPGLVTNVVSFDGPGKLDIDLLIPLGLNYQDERPAPLPTVSGSYVFNGVTAMPGAGGKVTELTGALLFSESTISSRNLRGKAYDNPLAIAVSGGGTVGVITELVGRADVVSVNDFLPFRLPAQVNGVADWNGRIVAKDGVNMVFTSNLIGVGSALPIPLDKKPSEAQKLTVSFSATGTPNEVIALQLGNSVYGKFARIGTGAAPTRLASGLISLGQPIGEMPLPAGLWLVGQAKQFDIDKWREALYPPGSAVTAGGNADTGRGPAGLDLSVERLTAYGRELRNATLKARRSGEDWQLAINSDELSGDVTWRPAAAGGSGLVRARLSNFVLNPEVARSAPTGQPAVESDFPALDITADRFEFHGRNLGTLDLQSQPDGRDWRIDKLVIQADGASLDAKGRWIRSGGPSRSEFQARVDAKNLNGLLRIFGYADAIRRGNGHLEGSLAWPGSPTDFAFRKLSGEFNLEARRGEFARIEPGAGRLLGLISLQSIPRRFTLDFRDLFSEGFAFDRIEGKFKIDAGVMRTDNFEIAGPAAYVTMQGEVSLPDESQSLKLTVIPALGDSLSLITTLIGGPIVGLTTLLAQKLLQDPLGRAFGYEYKVSGKWDNPDVVRVDGGQARATAGEKPATKPQPSGADAPDQKNEKSKS